MDVDRLADFCAENDNRSAQIIQIENGKAVWAAALCAALAALGIACSIHASYIAEQAAMEARVFQEKVNRLQGQFDAYKEQRK